MPLTANDPITAVRGIADRKAQIYHRMGIHTVEQLLRHLPRAYLNLAHLTPLDRIVRGQHCLILARIVKKGSEQRIRRGLSIFRVEAEADGLPLRLTFYNTRYAVEALRIEQRYLFYGVIEGTLLRPEMSAPQIFEQKLAGSLMPIYPATTGLSSRVIGRDVSQALAALTQPLPDALPADLLAQFGLPPVDRAVRAVHCPRDEQQALTARRRLIFDELLFYSAAMLQLRGLRDARAVRPLRCDDALMQPFWRSLPFTPTDDQRKAIVDILRDLGSGRLMNRLTQGDVGCGKTLVAAAAIYCMAKNGRQAAMMAPTELLARQHYATLQGLLEPLGVRVALLTGSMRAVPRREAEALLAAGECDVAVGTHALLSDSSRFARLGLVITDEQHRFGVAQRAALLEKGGEVHTLVMSATPIPRTLSLILYGDLEVSLIRQLPPGRTPVATYRIDPPKRQRAFGFIRDRLDEGRQAYVVCPLVEAAEQDEAAQSASDIELHAAADYAATLAKGAFAGYRVGLLHGKMKPAEKDKVMAAFAAGEIQLLVSTTVVEVGVDVPNAAVMLVENAERFGLSQLHQLRGRVGRGKHASYCILITEAKGQAVAERLKVLCKTNDGFAIAEEDLRLRGPGELLGARQHGEPGLQAAVLSNDPALFQTAQQAAAALLRQDPLLKSPANAAVRRAVHSLMERVGELPN